MRPDPRQQYPHGLPNQGGLRGDQIPRLEVLAQILLDAVQRMQGGQVGKCLEGRCGELAGRPCGGEPGREVECQDVLAVGAGDAGALDVEVRGGGGWGRCGGLQGGEVRDQAGGVVSQDAELDGWVQEVYSRVGLAAFCVEVVKVGERSKVDGCGGKVQGRGGIAEGLRVEFKKMAGRLLLWWW